MRTHGTRLVAALVGLLGMASAAGAQNFAAVGWEKFFTLEWESAARAGRPILRGHVVNTYGQPAGRVQLLVESLDASGRVAASTIDYVLSELQPGGRVYFEVPLAAHAPRYKVSVLSYERIEAGGDMR